MDQRLATISFEKTMSLSPTSSPIGREHQKKGRWFFPCVFWCLGLFLPCVWGGEPEKTPPRAAPAGPICGRLLQFDGEVYLFRTSPGSVGERDLLGPKKDNPIQCGDWISVSKGWAKLALGRGGSLDLGSHTFLQLQGAPDFELVLYRGLVFATAPVGGKELSLISSGARAQIKEGRALFLFDSQKEDSQLIAISGEVVLENRFLPTARVQLRPGEMSLLDFQKERIKPQNPGALSVNHLKALFLERLPLNRDTQLEALRIVSKRSERRLVSSLVSEEGPASSSEGKPRSPSVYQRHNAMPVDLPLKKHLIQKMTGGLQVDEDPLLTHTPLPESAKGVQIEVREKKKRGHRASSPSSQGSPLGGQLGSAVPTPETD